MVGWTRMRTMTQSFLKGLLSAALEASREEMKQHPSIEAAAPWAHSLPGALFYLTDSEICLLLSVKPICLPHLIPGFLACPQLLHSWLDRDFLPFQRLSP